MIRYRRSLNHKLCGPTIRGSYMDDSPGSLWEIISICIPGGVWSQGWNLKELTEGHHQEWNLRLNLTQHGETYQVRTQLGLTDWELFLDSVGGGAWPFLVGGVICLVNSVNERDLNLLISCAILDFGPFESWLYFLEGLLASLASGSLRLKQVCDALRCPGPHARYTDECNEWFPSPMGVGKLLKVRRDGDWTLQLLFMNEEFLVSVVHQTALITSLPFVHTARR